MRGFYLTGLMFFLFIFAQAGYCNDENYQLKDTTLLNLKRGEWSYGGQGAININQGYLSNWVEGGESSVSATWILNLNANYKRKNTVWDSFAKWKYGVLKSGDEKFRKNEDKFEFETKFGYTASPKWYYSGLVNLKSQLFNGYALPNDSVAVSGFFSPGGVIASIGLDYKPVKNFTLMLSTLSVKLIMVTDSTIDRTKYGLKQDMWYKGDFGGYIAAKWRANLHKNIVMDNKIELFSSYLYKPQNIDVDWEFSIVLKATKYISTTISTHLIYDDDIEIPVYNVIDGVKIKDETKTTKAIQFKELLSVGFSYKF